ncbi:putative ABC transporter permease [Agrilactobacillus yilanensis]|uniref:ABC transporter permease n=1 Tax=Agrilactobacillus yilanensis TaxID=2485997 RepID=A0ABW4J404_9LACO|nr:putative ABC transporter permease [Agrilactobacillus yilanensis]
MTSHAQILLQAEQAFSNWVLFFFAYAFIGWIWESCYVSVKQKHWINSGFLIGPFIPVYGFSITAVLAIVQPFEQNIWELYLTGVIVITVIEFITSWGMEKLFHARWWDYSKVPLNINGRVAIPVSLFWGIGVVAIVKLIHPLVSAWVSHISIRYGLFASIFFIAVIMFDLGFTLANLTAFRQATEKIGKNIDERKEKLRTDLASANAQLEDSIAWLRSFREDQESDRALPKINFVQRRLLKSFPTLRLNDTKTKPKDINQLVELFRQREKDRKNDLKK